MNRDGGALSIPHEDNQTIIATFSYDNERDAIIAIKRGANYWNLYSYSDTRYSIIYDPITNTFKSKYNMDKNDVRGLFVFGYNEYGVHIKAYSYNKYIGVYYSNGPTYADNYGYSQSTNMEITKVCENYNLNKKFYGGINEIKTNNKYNALKNPLLGNAEFYKEENIGDVYYETYLFPYYLDMPIFVYSESVSVYPGITVTYTTSTKHAYSNSYTASVKAGI